MSNSVFWEIKENVVNLSSAELAQKADATLCENWRYTRSACVLWSGFSLFAVHVHQLQYISSVFCKPWSNCSKYTDWSESSKFFFPALAIRSFFTGLKLYLVYLPKIFGPLTFLPHVLKSEKKVSTYCLVFGKQCRPWSDAAFCGVWSGSKLFAQNFVQILWIKTVLSEQIPELRYYLITLLCPQLWIQVSWGRISFILFIRCLLVRSLHLTLCTRYLRQYIWTRALILQLHKRSRCIDVREFRGQHKSANFCTREPYIYKGKLTNPRIWIPVSKIIKLWTFIPANIYTINSLWQSYWGWGVDHLLYPFSSLSFCRNKHCC